jgi:hypothetical protein
MGVSILKAVSMAVCVGVVLVLVALGTGFARSSLARFSITITAPKTVIKSGSPVVVELILTNISKRNLTLEDRSPMCDYVVEVRDSANKLAPDTEYKRTLGCGMGPTIIMSGRDSLLPLMPNGSRGEQFVVSQLSDMSQPGTYSVQISRQIPKSLGGGVVKSNTITVTVTP